MIDPNTHSGGPWFLVFCSCWVITTRYVVLPKGIYALLNYYVLAASFCVSASLRGQPDESALVERIYEKEHWGFRVSLPTAWQVHREVDVPDEFRVSFGLPKIWSEKEKARIENAVSISVYRKEAVKNVNDVVRLESERIADILLSKKDITVKEGITFDSRTRINNLEYVSRTVCRYENGLGYVLNFTATDGTFAQNLPSFEKVFANASFHIPSEIPRRLKERSHYDLAREYYKFGPSHAKKIIAELEQHVVLEKQDEKAFMLLGITQKGIGLFDAALKTFSAAEKIGLQNGSVRPQLFLLRAECHVRKNEFQQAHDVLKPAWAFFQNDQKEKARYDALMASIAEQLDGP